MESINRRKQLNTFILIVLIEQTKAYAETFKGDLVPTLSLRLTNLVNSMERFRDGIVARIPKHPETGESLLNFAEIEDIASFLGIIVEKYIEVSTEAKERMLSLFVSLTNDDLLSINHLSRITEGDKIIRKEDVDTLTSRFRYDKEVKAILDRLE